MTNHIHPSMPGKIISTREVIRWGDATVYGIVDGKEIQLFSYYTDELDINHKDLVGMTPAEAIKFKRHKDERYLQS